VRSNVKIFGSGQVTVALIWSQMTFNLPQNLNKWTKSREQKSLCALRFCKMRSAALKSARKKFSTFFKQRPVENLWKTNGY
jgi:hypothetical protein